MLQALERIFQEVVAYAANVEASSSKSLNPDFFIAASPRDAVLKTHFRLCAEDAGYDRNYREMVSGLRDFDEMSRTSLRIRLIQKISNPTIAMAAITHMGPVLFPVRSWKLDQNQKNLFATFDKTPEADALRAQYLPGPAPLL